MPGETLVAHQEFVDLIASEAQRGAEPEVGQPPHDEILHVALRAAVVCRRFLQGHDFGQLFECVHTQATVSKCGAFGSDRCDLKPRLRHLWLDQFPVVFENHRRAVAAFQGHLWGIVDHRQSIADVGVT